MFERYTETARRIIFFARYEASMFGSTTIETEHLLLGLNREGRMLYQHLLPTIPSIESIRAQIEGHVTIREKITTSIDLPLSDECKRILAFAEEESTRLGKKYIGPEHLLLGILREESCHAAKILKELGLDLETTRVKISQLPPSPVESPGFRGFTQFPKTPMPAAGIVPDIETAKRIAEAVWLHRLSAVAGDNLETLHAELTFGVWIVTSSHTRNGVDTKLAAFIQKDDGKILRLHQEKASS